MKGSPRGGAPKGNRNAYKPGARRRSYRSRKTGPVKPKPPDPGLARLRNHAQMMCDGVVLYSPYGPGGVSVWNGRAVRGQLKAMKQAQMREAAKKLPDDAVGRSAEQAICDVYDTLCAEPEIFASGDRFLTRLRQLVLKDHMWQVAAGLPSNINAAYYLGVWERICALLYECVWPDPESGKDSKDRVGQNGKGRPLATKSRNGRAAIGSADRRRSVAIPIRAVPPPPVQPVLPEPRDRMAGRAWNGGLLRRDLQARAKARRKTALRARDAGKPVAAAEGFAACEVLRVLCRNRGGFASPLRFAFAVLDIVGGMAEDARREVDHGGRQAFINRQRRAQICINLFNDICADRLGEEICLDLLRTFVAHVEAMRVAAQDRKAA